MCRYTRARVFRVVSSYNISIGNNMSSASYDLIRDAVYTCPPGAINISRI